MSCKHEKFVSYSNVHRLCQKEGGPVTHYSAEIYIKCSQCGIKFEFFGLPFGLSSYFPTTSLDKETLRVPIMPPGINPPEGLPGMFVNNDRSPVNPFGSCFDAAAWLLVSDKRYDSAMMCHGTGIANMRGQEGEPIAHAWIEVLYKGKRHAIDPIWMVAQPSEAYRKNFQMNYVVEYPKQQFIDLWQQHDFPGPYDDRIKELTIEGRVDAERF